MWAQVGLVVFSKMSIDTSKHMPPKLWKTVRDRRGRCHQSTRCTWQSIGCKRPFIAWVPTRTVSGWQDHDTSLLPSKLSDYHTNGTGGCVDAAVQHGCKVSLHPICPGGCTQVSPQSTLSLLWYPWAMQGKGIVPALSITEHGRHHSPQPMSTNSWKKPAFHFGKILCLPFKRRRISTLDPMWFVVVFPSAHVGQIHARRSNLHQLHYKANKS